MLSKKIFENPFVMPEEKHETVHESSREIRVAGGTTRLYEIIPSPEDIKDARPFFWAPGFGGTKSTYENGLKFLAKKYGLRIATIDHPRFGENKHIPLEAASEGLEKTASNILGAIKELQIEHLGPINAGAHSRGAIDLITAAAEQPERFENIILVAPAGLIGKDTIKNLATRFFEHAEKQENLQHPFEKNAPHGKNISESAVTEGIAYVLKNISRSIDEVFGISNSDIRAKIKKLKENGVSVSIIASITDPLFSLDKMTEALGPLVEKGVLEAFWAIRTIAGHSIYEDENCFDAIGYMLETIKKNKESIKLNNGNR